MGKLDREVIETGLLNHTSFFQILKELLGPYYDMKLIPPHLVQEPKLEGDEEVDDKFSIQSLLPGFGKISETACQTDHNPTTETPCQTNTPKLVSTGTQWSEKDFLPDPQVIEQEHAYCKKRHVSVACQVETLSVPMTRAAKSRKTYKTIRRFANGRIFTMRMVQR